MAAFEDAALRQWELELLEHARVFAPGQAAVAGEDNLKLVVSSVMQRCERYRFTDRGPIRLFLELVLSCGSGFDTDPLLSWASSTLLLDLDQHRRAARLYNASCDYFLFVHGKDDEYAVAALRRALLITRDSLSNEPASALHAGKLLRSTFPEKCDFSGLTSMRIFLQSAAGAARHYAFATSYEQTVLTGVMFAFGHHAHSDPLYPWIAKALATSGPDRAAKLHKDLNLYLKHMIPVLEGAV